MGIARPKEVVAKEKARLRQALGAIVAEQVVHLLGQPDGFINVAVNRLWKHRYRVNVITGASLALSIIGHSYFVTTDGEGNIIASDPQITKTA
jgi:hypothetical protein